MPPQQLPPLGASNRLAATLQSQQSQQQAFFQSQATSGVVPARGAIVQPPIHLSSSFSLPSSHNRLPAGPAAHAVSVSSSSLGARQAFASMSSMLESTCDRLDKFKRQMLEHAVDVSRPPSGANLFTTVNGCQRENTCHVAPGNININENSEGDADDEHLGRMSAMRLHTDASSRQAEHERSVLSSLEKIHESLERLVDMNMSSSSSSSSSPDRCDQGSAPDLRSSWTTVNPHQARHCFSNASKVGGERVPRVTSATKRSR